jgi:hypothetical protein
VILHVANGDVAAGRLREADLDGDVVTLIDALHEGPTPAGLPPAQWRACRARFVAAAGWATFDGALARLTEADTALESAARYKEVVLWFEHDLNCQLALIRVLDRLRDLASATRLGLVCIDTYPGRSDFMGLGQLTPAELGGLFDTREAVSVAALDLAHAAWAAFCAPDPWPLLAVGAGSTQALPFLGRALRRHLEQFPSRAIGLARTDREILDALATGITDRAALFRAVQRRESAPFMGDTIFFDYVSRWASARNPLIAGADGDLHLTDAALAMRAGGADAVALNGIDRWLGGVHLRDDRVWRWDNEGARSWARPGERGQGGPSKPVRAPQVHDRPQRDRPAPAAAVTTRPFRSATATACTSRLANARSRRGGRDVFARRTRWRRSASRRASAICSRISTYSRYESIHIIGDLLHAR